MTVCVQVQSSFHDSSMATVVCQVLVTGLVLFSLVKLIRSVLTEGTEALSISKLFIFVVVINKDLETLTSTYKISKLVNVSSLIPVFFSFDCFPPLPP